MTKLDVQDGARQLRELVESHQRFWVTVHEGPDGDSIGAALAVQRVLSALGKQAVAIRHAPFPQVFYDLPSAGDMVDGQRLERLWRPEVIIACDVGSIERTGGVPSYLDAGTTLVNIDHHPGSPGPIPAGRLLNLLDATSASTTMLAYVLLEAAWPGCVDAGTASCLYVGLITDTGCFRFSNTSVEALRVGSELAQRGADPGALAEHYMFRRRPQALQLLGDVLSSLAFHADGRLAILHLTDAMLRRTGARMDETEGFVNYATSLDGVEVAVLLREIDAQNTKLSLRASGDFDVSQVARRFGGGGHAKAAGMSLPCDLLTASDRIVAALLEALPAPAPGAER
jgi:phosphoesterase RecJ-like protein